MGIVAGVIGAAVIGAGASIVSGNKAAKAQRDAATQATGVETAQLNEATREYNQSRDDLAPWRGAGTTALGQMAAMNSNTAEQNQEVLNNDPGYQFRLAQGNRGVEASAAARGSVLSGGTLKALAEYNQGEASQEFGNRYNRLATIAGFGQNATNNTVAAQQSNTATQAAGARSIADNVLAAGNATASQYVNAGNAIGGAANTIGSLFGAGFGSPRGSAASLPPGMSSSGWRFFK